MFQFKLGLKRVILELAFLEITQEVSQVSGVKLKLSEGVIKIVDDLWEDVFPDVVLLIFFQNDA